MGWQEASDDEVFVGGAETPGSQRAYDRSLEAQRRVLALQREAVKVQIDATAAQREAIAEMRKQSNILVASVIGVFLTAVVTMIAAFIN